MASCSSRRRPRPTRQQVNTFDPETEATGAYAGTVSGGLLLLGRKKATFGREGVYWAACLRPGMRASQRYGAVSREGLCVGIQLTGALKVE